MFTTSTQARCTGRLSKTEIHTTSTVSSSYAVLEHVTFFISNVRDKPSTKLQIDTQNDTIFVCNHKTVMALWISFTTWVSAVVHAGTTGWHMWHMCLTSGA